MAILLSCKMIGGIPRNPFQGIRRPLDGWEWEIASEGRAVNIYDVRNGSQRAIVLAEAHGLPESIQAFKNCTEEARESGFDWTYLIEGFHKRGSDFEKYEMNRLVDSGAVVVDLPDLADGMRHLVRDGLASIEEWAVMEVFSHLERQGLRRRTHSGYGLLNDAAIDAHSILALNNERSSGGMIINWARAALSSPLQFDRAVSRSSQLSCEAWWISNELQSQIVREVLGTGPEAILIVIGAAHMESLVSPAGLIPHKKFTAADFCLSAENIQWALANAV